MKHLILIRHGKSSWEYAVSDFDRPLLESGIKDALLIGSKLESQKNEIDAVYSSPANRALHTSIIVMRQLGFPFHNFHVTNELYDFSGESVIKFIKSLDNRLRTVMIFGHNHAFTHIANSLGNTYIDNVPTAGLVELRFEVTNWKSVAKGTTKQTMFPKHFRE